MNRSFRPPPFSCRALPLIAVGVLCVAACGGSEDDDAGIGSIAESDATSVDVAPSATSTDQLTNDGGQTTDPDSSAGAATTTTSAATTTTSTTTTTIPPRGASAADPAPMGDPAFDLLGYDSEGNLTDTHILGTVSVPLEADSAESGTCLAVLGVYTAASVDGLVLPIGARPRIEILDGDEPLYTSDFECDSAALRAAGFGDPLQANVTEGTQFAFGAVALVPVGVEASTVLVGRIGDDRSRFFEPTFLGAMPAAPPLTVGTPPIDLRSVSDPSANMVRVEGSLLDDQASFDVAISGTTATPLSELADDIAGRCVTVVGALTGVESVGAIINAFAVPDVQLLVDGRIVEQAIGNCDTEALRDIGYGSINSSGVAVDNTYAFETSFFVADGLDVDAVVLGDATTPDEYWLFEPADLAEVPPAPERQRVNPKLDLVAAGSVPTFELEQSDRVWTGTIGGLLELTSDAQGAQCFAIVGEITRQGEPGFAPDAGVIAGGAYYGSPLTFVQCDNSALEAAGYVQLRDAAQGAPAGPVPFFEIIFLPLDAGETAAIAIGNAASADDVVFVEPLVIIEVPAR